MGITQSKRLATYFQHNNTDRAGRLTPRQRRRLRKKSNQLLKQAIMQNTDQVLQYDRMLRQEGINTL